MAPAGDPHAFSTGQSGLEIGGARGSKCGKDVLVGAIDIDNNCFGQAVGLLDRFLKFGVYSRRHCDNGADNPEFGSPFEQP